MHCAWGGGGGIAIVFEGSFTMRGGRIINNTARTTDGLQGIGGGICKRASSSGPLDIYAGEISGNKAEGTNGYGGGGIYCGNGTVTLHSASTGGGAIIIKDNTTTGTADADAPKSGNMRRTGGELKEDGTIRNGATSAWTLAGTGLTVPATGAGGWVY
jgi:hypothetical protein